MHNEQPVSRSAENMANKETTDEEGEMGEMLGSAPAAGGGGQA